MIISAGTDTYGRVKEVSGTPIVTQFAMLQAFPLYPLRSFYLVRSGPTEFEGIPLIASAQSTAIVGIPLASVDMTSVLVGYLRGVFGALVLFGFLFLFMPAFMYLIGDRGGRFSPSFLRWVVILFSAGVLGGALSYLVPLTNRREKDIRRYCGEILGIAADPARVLPETSAQLAEKVATLAPAREPSKAALIRELVQSRANISQDVERGQMERRTDELLGQLRSLERCA
jgi:hypothetical protein